MELHSGHPAVNLPVLFLHAVITVYKQAIAKHMCEQQLDMQARPRDNMQATDNRSQNMQAGLTTGNKKPTKQLHWRLCHYLGFLFFPPRI